MQQPGITPPDGLRLPPGFQTPPEIVPKPYDPVTNPLSSFLPESDQELGTGGESVALVPLPDENTLANLDGTVDWGTNLPSLGEDLKEVQVSDAAAEALGLTGFTSNFDETAFLPGVTDENILAFTNTDPLGGDSFSTINNVDSGFVALGGSLDDFSIPVDDGSSFVASNTIDGNYEDFYS